ncbi:Uncharacterized protein APZ42_029552 [Daphnia magna]|uniref:Uncharacterized protein n=1 Tax=Daphnia magna TaxID=35525 RepID=A0A164PNZ3_9CRUS|nr:Uncharacterized protein APZ42_029552 [Daphnia magna]
MVLLTYFGACSETQHMAAVVQLAFDFLISRYNRPTAGVSQISPIENSIQLIDKSSHVILTALAFTNRVPFTL